MRIHPAMVLCALPLVAGAQSEPAPPGPAQIASAVARYESGSGMEPLRAIETLVRESLGQPQLRDALEAALAAVLTGDSTFEARRFACQCLAIIGSESSLPAIGGLLENDETVGIACLALAPHPSPKASGLLLAALEARTGPARAQIINTLGDRRDAHSVPLLSKLARDADTAAADAAIAALAKIDTPPAREAIGALRQAPRPALTAALAEASLRSAEGLAASGDRKAATALFEDFCLPSRPAHLRRGAFAALLRLDADGGEQRILDALNGQDDAVKPVAIAGVASLQSDGASARFASKMADLDPGQQILMIGALASRGDGAARDAITAHIGNTNRDVAVAAIRTLGTLGDASSVPAIADVVIESTDTERIDAALMSLGQLRGTASTTAILDAATAAPPDARARLIGVLIARRATGAVPFLIQQAAQDNPRVAASAFRGLARLAEPKDLPALLELLVNLRHTALEDDACGAVVQVARRIANRDVRSEAILATYRKTGAVPVRCALLRALSQTAGTRALDAVLAALDDPDQRIRDAASRALANWSDRSAAPAILARAGSASDATLRILLLRGYIRLLGLGAEQPQKDVLAGYALALQLASRPDEKRMVIAALSASGVPGALPLLAPLLDDPALQEEVAIAVVRIARANPGADREQARSLLSRAASIAKDPAQQREARELLNKLK